VPLVRHAWPYTRPGWAGVTHRPDDHPSCSGACRSWAPSPRSARAISHATLLGIATATPPAATRGRSAGRRTRGRPRADSRHALNRLASALRADLRASEAVAAGATRDGRSESAPETRFWRGTTAARAFDWGASRQRCAGIPLPGSMCDSRYPLLTTYFRNDFRPVSFVPPDKVS
jgi:hypothetical protein